MEKDYIAKVTITAFPQTKADKLKLVKWLCEKASDIRDSNSDEYSKTNVRFKLMK